MLIGTLQLLLMITHSYTTQPEEGPVAGESVGGNRHVQVTHMRTGGVIALAVSGDNLCSQ